MVRTARMKANLEEGLVGYHDEEHDFVEGCETSPRCEPILDPIPAYGSSGRASYDPPPTHYATDKGIDPWAVWDAFDLDRYTANAVKYLLRAGKKDIAPRLDDLKKAANYVAKAIEMEENRSDLGRAFDPVDNHPRETTDAAHD